MHVQTIQSTNNSNQSNFKARFINDKNGNFQRLWEDAWKSKSLSDKAKYFSKNYPSDSLEIFEIKTADIIHDEYHVFNHNTGAKSSYILSSNSPKYGILEKLLDFVNKDKHLFDRDFSANIYNLLLGKK